MAFTELTKGTTFTEITGVNSKDLATNPDKDDIIKEMGNLLKQYTQSLELTTERDNNRNSGQDR